MQTLIEPQQQHQQQQHVLQQQSQIIKPNPKLEKNNKILNELKIQYEQLKKLFESPRVYLSNAFADLRSEVDIAFISMNQTETFMEVKHKLNDCWFQMIEKINTFETECLKVHGNNGFNNDFSQEVREKIEIIDKILSELNNQATIEETFHVDNKEEKTDEDDGFNEVGSLIYEEIYKIEKRLFLNKTMMFLDKSNWNETSLFDKMNTKLSFGKLFFVQNEYFGKQTIGLVKNKIKTIGHPILTSEVLKSKELRKIMAINLTSDAIDEITLDLTNLTEIDLSYGQYSKIEESVFISLNKLKIIYLNDNELKSLDKTLFASLLELTHIHLYFNQIKFIHSNAFNTLTKLVYIGLSKNRLSVLDKSTFSGLIQLKEIHLSDNLLTNLETGLFTGLNELKLVDLFNNKLTVIEPTIFNNLTKLERIDLSNNELISLDSNIFSGLINLRKINLRNNNLTTLDSNTFLNLSKLSAIDLSGNQLMELPCTIFNGLVKLKELCLGHNKLNSLDKAVFNDLVKLEKIYLSNNNLETINKCIFIGLTNLKEVWLGGNKLKLIDVSMFNGLKNLTNFHLDS